MPEQFNATLESIMEYLPNLLGAIAILVVGLIVAWVISSFVKKGLKRTKLDEKIVGWTTGKKEENKKIQSEKWISKAVFYLIILFALIGFFEVLQVPIITEPLNNLLSVILEFLPRILAAIVLLILTWIVASVVRALIKKTLGSTDLDQKFRTEVNEDTKNTNVEISEKKVKDVSITNIIANTAYWLVFLLFLPAILNVLSLDGVMEPINDLVNNMLAFLPNLLLALLILAAGWFIAQIVQRIVTKILECVGLNNIGDKAEINKRLGSKKLAGTVGLIAFVLIFILAIIAALNVLHLDFITQPASNMLDSILNMLPSIFAAVLLLIISYIVGKLVSEVVRNLLSNVGFDNILSKVGLDKSDLKDKVNTIRRPANIVGKIVFFAIMFFAVVESLQLLGFTSISGLATNFLFFAGNVLLGIVIFILGLYLANFAYDIVKSRNIEKSDVLAPAARIAIIVLVSAMALEQMGFANDIIVMFFGFGFGATAIAFAIAFGLGGRDFASKQISKWSGSSDNDSNNKSENY